MMFVATPEEPADFEEKVRAPGRGLLQELRGDPSARKRTGPKRKAVTKITSAKLTDYWTRCLPDLWRAFRGVCGYACLYVDPVSGASTVDHWKPKSLHPDDAYEWGNLRFACLTMNRRRERGGEICDPYAVKDGWFVVNLVTFGIAADPGLSPDVRDRVEHTIRVLELDREPMRKRREEAWRLFENDRTLRGWALLVRDCPLVAREYLRQGGTVP
jgi:hypothetical protein